MAGCSVGGSMRSSRRVAFALGAAACASGSPDTGGGDGADKSEFTCELGSFTEEGGFAPFGANAELELQMGFQGFLLVSAYVSTSERDFPAGDAAMSMVVEGADRIDGKQPGVAFVDGLSDEILIFFTANYLSYYEGRGADLVVRVEDVSRYCVVSASGTLVDDDPCIHTGADPICPEDTGP